MASAVETKPFVFRFADVTVREGEFALLIAGQVQQVEPKAFRVLLILIRNPNRLITKEELLNSVWADAAVTENSLARNIALLRRVLGDDPRDPHFIETVPAIGYRFVCPVEVAEDTEGMAASGSAAPADATSPKISPASPADAVKTPSRRAWLVAAGLAALGLAFCAWYLRRPLPPPRISAYTQLTHDGREKWPSGTDGNRVYFTDFVFGPVSQVAVSGGEIARVPIALPFAAHLENVSPDGTRLIVDTDELGVVFNRPQWIVSMLGELLCRLPDGTAATFSPDGKTVAYVTSDGGIWNVQTNGTGAQKLATVEGAGGLSWSPDGSAIRFHKDNQLWEISSNGSNLHPLFSGRRPPGGQCCGHWTADGKFFLFRSGNLGTGDTGIWAIDERPRLPLQPRAEPVQLTSGPVWWGELVPGKDAKKIFAEGATRRGELARYDAQTKHFLPFLGGISAGCVTFSRDGRFVAYVLYPEGTLWKANRDGSNPVRLSDPPISAHSPRWSPDGKQIVFTDLANVTSSIVDSRLSEVYVVSAEGGSPQRILPDDNGSEGDPTWSPDGRGIAYGWNQSGRFGATCEIRILDLGSRQSTTVPGSVGVCSPRWSPDGRYIAGIGPHQRELGVFNTATQKWTGLVEGKWIAYNQWSSDSRWIYFLADGAVERVAVSGGKVERVAELKDWPLAGWWGWMGLDPDDAPMVLHDVGSADIYALSLDEK
jgi:DNA-binding winged helix-turn-helix (wHTH) protein/Tol biopolymer transport system component